MSTEAEAIAALAQKRAEVVSGPDARSFLIVPPGYVSREITDPNGLPSKPAYVRQAVTVDDADSMKSYLGWFGLTRSVLFADVKQNRITAAIDYHEHDDVVDDEATADHVLHRATLNLPFSEEWSTWTARSGQLMKQEDFARFLEENRADVTKPDGATLIEITRELHAHRNAHWGKVVRDGNVERFEYQEDVTAGSGKKGDLPMPPMFTITIPVYLGGDPVEMEVFLRWQLADKGMMLGYKIARAELVRQGEFRVIASDISDHGSVSDDGKPWRLVYGAISDDWNAKALGFGTRAA